MKVCIPSPAFMALIFSCLLAFPVCGYSASTTLWRFSGGTATDITNLWAPFGTLSGGIQHFDYDSAGITFGVWAAGTDSLINHTGTYHHTFDGTITGLASYNDTTAFVTLDNGELWRFSGGTATDITNLWAPFGTLSGGIQHFDYDSAGITFGVWAAGTDSLINHTGTYHHTFDGTITGLASYNDTTAFVTLDNGELWRFSGGTATDITNLWAPFGTLSGGIQHFDYDSAGITFGVWAAGTDSLINHTGTYHHTFDGTITGLASYNDTTAYVIVSTVPVPAAFWLFVSGLIGLIGFARHR